MSGGALQRIELTTNAPPHWPRFYLLAGEIERGAGPRAAERQILKGLKRAGNKQARIIPSERFMIREGIVTSTLGVVEGNVHTPVYLYTDDLSAVAPRFAWVHQALVGSGRAAPVYYAPALMPAAAPVAPALDWGRNAAAPTRRSGVQRGLHAVWWGPQANPDTEPGLRALHRAYGSMHGFESVVILRLEQLGLMRPHMVDRLVRGEPLLEQRDRVVPISLPDGRTGAITLSHEKGIRFLFHVEATPPAYRDQFLKQFADYVEGLRREYEASGKGAPDKQPSGGAMWWAGMEQVLRKGIMPSQGGLHVLGGFDI